MNLEQVKYWIALKSIPGIGNTAITALIDYFGEPAAIFNAEERQLCQIEGIGPKSARSILSFKNWQQVLRQIDSLHKTGIQIITCRDQLYPARLLTIYDRPALLYVRGTLNQKDVSVAMVGSRRASTYGKYTTEKISRDLALQGVTIVSGLARGIDSSAHRGALSVDGRTIAVLGCGLNVVYPPENRKLFEEIVHRGALISEFAPDAQPMPYHFPARNRIISGMSYGVVVVEAGEKSGSLITARLAMEQGRDVFAIPGTIDSPSSRGTHSLIKQGAKLIENAYDIIEDILPQVEITPPVQSICSKEDNRSPGTFISIKPPAPIDTLDARIVNVLSSGIKHVDDIITSLDTVASGVLSALITLELNGIIEQYPGKYFALKK